MLYTGNATMERFWAFLGLCLRQMTDKQYEHFDEYLQDIAWAWNTTLKESLGSISPFEVYSGTRPRTLIGSAMDHGPTTTTIDMNSVRVSAAEFTRVALANADFCRERNAMHLNERDQALRQFEVGDRVKIYKPPGQAEAKRRNRKL